MPWTADEFRKKHNKRLTDEQASRAAGIANDVLARSGSDAFAIKVANASMRDEAKCGGKKKKGRGCK